MPSLVANENIWRGFRRMASGMGGTVKSYLLKTAGLTAHDIRLFPGKQGPFWMRPTLVPSEYPWYARFNPTFCIGDIFILNASSTSPVIIEEHILLEIPKKVPVSISRSVKEKGDVGYSHTKEKSAGFRVSMLENIPEEVAVTTLPELKAGVVIRGPQEPCAFSLTFDFLEDRDVQEAGNSTTYNPTRGVQDQMHLALSQFMNECVVWYGLVLNSEELMPYRWSHTDRRFVPEKEKMDIHQICNPQPSRCLYAQID